MGNTTLVIGGVPLCSEPRFLRSETEPVAGECMLGVLLLHGAEVWRKSARVSPGGLRRTAKCRVEAVA